MRLKKVEVAGFKSFMDRTCFSFESGVTAVVGPNGCGKSNIVDAIRWAMGEQSAKSLRGRLMEDVIFSGSDSLKPLGMAEVKLTFENGNGHVPPELTGCTEIEVSRRLFRSGDSEYAINRVPCRRRDIWELFMDTGLGNRSYAIVEQDRVAQIVHAKPEERRVVIEEVAGISKYKSRKEAAERKLEATRQNLLRIQDIRSEVGKQVRGLERQAQRARRYKRLRGEIREAERGILLRDWRDLHIERETIDGKLGDLNTQQERITTDLNRDESALAEGRLGIVQQERRAADAQEVVHKHESLIKELEGKAEGYQSELQALENLEGHLEKESTALKKRLEASFEEREELSGEKNRLKTEVGEAEETVAQLNGVVVRLTKERNDLVRELESTKDRLVDLLSERATLRNSITHHQRQENEIQRFLERYRSEERTLKERLSEIAQSIASHQARLREEKNGLATLEGSRLRLRQELDESEQLRTQLQSGFQETKTQLNELRSRCASLEELQNALEGFDAGVQAIRNLEDEGLSFGDGSPRLLAEVMDIPQEMEASVTGLLGERLQYFVVKDPEEGLEALTYIRDQGLGRVGFMPLRSGDNHEPIIGQEDSRERGANGFFKDVVWESGYEALGQLFEDVVLVDDAGEALEEWRSNGRHRIVTREGDVVHPSGVVEAGVRKDATTEYLRRKREMRELEKSIDSTTTQEADIIRHLDEVSQKISQLHDRAAQVEREIRQTENRLFEVEKENTSAQEARESANRRIEVLQWEVEERMHDLSVVRQAVQEETQRLASVEQGIEEDEGRTRTLGEKDSGLQRELNVSQSLATEAQVNLATARERYESLDREIYRLENQIKELERERAKKEQQQQERLDRTRVLKEKLESIRHRLKVNLEEHRSAGEELEVARKDLEEHRIRLGELESACQEGRRKQRESEQLIQELVLQQQELTLRMDHLAADLRNRLDMDDQQIPQAAAGLPASEPEEEQRKLDELKEALQRLGEVNLMAVDQFEELQERYDFLTTQQEDLENSIRSLRKAIFKINRASRKRFKDAFAALDEQFQKVFPILFEGGAAHLTLTESPDVLDAGVDIVARPPGKRLQSISLLSGGEKALTGVALIFAMILVKPSPFCLFDEVDAPLDDANIDRFNQMVRELASESQFILVTHNKRTMEMADALYGITMETPGVSKLISVRLQ